MFSTYPNEDVSASQQAAAANADDSDDDKNQSSSSTTTTFSVHTSIDDLLDRYDGFILDQFGVLHNGREALPGAVEAVERLYASGKRLCILSNTSSSSQACRAKLPALGFTEQERLFLDAVTSGQEAGDYIRREYNNKPIMKALFLTWKKPHPGPAKFLEVCGTNNIVITTDPAEADLVLLHGVGALRGPTTANDDGEDVTEEQSLGDFFTTGNMQDKIDPILQACAQRNLPMICANPDLIMVRPDGSIGYMPGTIAKRYSTTFGGTVKSFGKPHREHFEACLQKMDLPAARVAHVGDSLHHDVAGANGVADLASIFITGGIHRAELGTELGELPNETVLRDLFAKHGQTPSHVLPLFRF